MAVKYEAKRDQSKIVEMEKVDGVYRAKDLQTSSRKN
jgi:hypothetical protein